MLWRAGLVGQLPETPVDVHLAEGANHGTHQSCENCGTLKLRCERLERAHEQAVGKVRELESRIRVGVL